MVNHGENHGQKQCRGPILFQPIIIIFPCHMAKPAEPATGHPETDLGHIHQGSQFDTGVVAT